VTLVHGIQLFRRASGGEWNKNVLAYDSSHIFSIDSAIAADDCPTIVYYIHSWSRFLWTFISWILVVGFLVGTSIYMKAENSIQIILIYVLFSAFIMFDFYWQSFIMFNMIMKL
jgi:hypothetical protein